MRKQARLDYFLIGFSCFTYAEASSITHGYRTDHSGTILDLILDFDVERGKGYWKFNNSLLKDIDYIKIVKETISDVKQTYSMNETQFSINDQLFLETLLLMIRGNTIKYSSFKKKQKQEEEIKLEQEIKLIEKEVNRNFLNMSEESLNNLETKKQNYMIFKKTKLKV